MSKIYNNNYVSTGKSIFPQLAQPLDLRSVVQTIADLEEFDNATVPYTYLGMIVVVIADETRANGSVDNNGIWYRYKDEGAGRQTTNWKQITASEASSIEWPDAPSDWETKNYYLKYSETNGKKTPIWVEINIPEGQSSFEFNVHSPYQELNSGDGYSIESDMSSSQEMTLTNTYKNDTETADVIAVKDSSNIFHLMLNPELGYILHGGDSEGKLRVKLTITPIIEMDISELPSEGIGIKWLMNQVGAIITIPNDAELNWFDHEVDPDNNTESSLDPNNDFVLTSTGSFTRYCYASKTDWLPSLLRIVTFIVTEETITITVDINDVRRTTAE